MHSPLSDKELVKAALNGCQESFTELITRYRKRIYSISYKIALNEEDALEITQNVYLKLVEKLKSYSGRGSFKAWLTSLTTFAAIDFHRKRKNYPLSTEPELLTFMSDKNKSTDADAAIKRITNSRSKELINSAMESLSPQQRAIYTLRFRQGLKPKEIADELNINASQVSVQCSRIISKLREVFKTKGVIENELEA